MLTVDRTGLGCVAKSARRVAFAQTLDLAPYVDYSFLPALLYPLYHL
jgi:hypothetical protein